METELKPNEGKKGIITVDGAQYLRLPEPLPAEGARA